MSRPGYAICRRAVATCLVLSSGAAAGELLAGAPAWATDQLRDWLAAYNSRDATAIGRFYADGAVLRPYAKPPVRGRAAIVQHYRAGLATETATCSANFDGFKVAANVAVGWGQDRCDYPPTKDAQPRPYRARWLLIYERDLQGHWLIVQDVDEGPES